MRDGYNSKVDLALQKLLPFSEETQNRIFTGDVEHSPQNKKLNQIEEPE